MTEYGFTEKELREIEEISPILLKRVERYLCWEDRLRIFYINESMPLYAMTWFVIYFCLWLVTWILAMVLHLNFAIMLAEIEVWNLIYAVLTTVILFIGEKGYLYCRKKRYNLYRVIKKYYFV